MVLDWATITGIVVALAAIAGLIIQYLKRERPWEKVVNVHQLRISAIELEHKHIEESIELLRKRVNEHDERDQKDFERIEKKIEKLTDLMIELIQQDSAKNNNRDFNDRRK